MEFIKTTKTETDICLSSEIRTRQNSSKKNYFNKINNKPWGKEYLVYQNKNLAIWVLHINKNCATSTHCHFKKDTILFPISGCFKINLIDSFKILYALDKLYVPRNTFHGLHAYSDDAIIMEIEIYTDVISYTDKNDLLRLRDNYKRDKTNYEKSVVEEDVLENEIMNLHKMNETFVMNKTFVYCTDDIEKIRDNDTVILLKGKLFTENSIKTSGSLINTKKPFSQLSQNVEFLCLKNDYLSINKKIIYSKSQLKDFLKLNKSKIGLTSGCFDIVHGGHINTLKISKKNVERVMVCLSSDEQIKRLKGGDRPINTLKDRLNMLLHFDFVDNVILYEETDDDKQAELDVIINIIKPYFWFKGPDYNVAEIKKLHPILDNIMVIKSPFSSSTTKIIKRIKGY